MVTTVSPSPISGFQMHIVRSNLIKLLVLIAALCVPVYIAFELAPLWDRKSVIAKAFASREYEEARGKVIYGKRPGQTNSSYFEFPVSELTVVAIGINAIDMPDGVITKSEAEVKLRPDRVILWMGTVAVLLAVLATVLPGFLSRLRVGPLRIDFASHEAGVSIPGSMSLPPQPSAKLSPVDLFAAEVDAAGRRADLLFSRSTLLLTGGVIMAFIGVGIFYVSLPETKVDETLTSYWPKVVRPTGVLIFVESIAWFLLRQYRALVEDYKWFYRLYLKRANYLAAIRILGVENLRPEDTFVAVSLIQEDYSGRLKTGETTESLEAQKLPEQSPITEALHAFSNINAKFKPEKAKEQATKGKGDV
ncbi:MAG TPA: hypothetical protein VGA09_23910 [Candidatus Binatia bacterium]